MSKGEDVHAYTRLLKFQKKRYGVGIIDILILLLALFLMIGVTLLLTNSASGGGGTLIFIVGTIYTILLIIAFLDYSLNLGLFRENGMYYSSAIILGAVLYSVIISLFAGNLFPDNNRRDLLALFSLVNMLLNGGIISYYITTTTPTREGKEEMILRLSEMRKEISNVPIADLGSKQAVEKSLKWIQFQQRSDSIWGEKNPLYETAVILNMFTQMGKGIDYSWKAFVDGMEETHTVEQTYYLILEALDTASIEPSNEILIPLLAVTEIDNQFTDINHEVMIEFKESLDRYTEWEFVKDIQRFDETNERIDEIPIILTMGKIFLLKMDYETAQKCADILANTFGILINRAATRFNVTSDKEISNLLLGKMYNALVGLVRIKTPTITENVGTSLDTSDDFSVPDIENIDFDESMGLSDLDLGVPGLTGLADDLSIDKQDNLDDDRPQIRIGTALASIRGYIKEKQSIDGSWSGNLEHTSECLLAVSDQESSESDYIKSAVHYLLALQEKNGSWQNDIILTAKVASTLDQINRTVDLGAF